MQLQEKLLELFSKKVSDKIRSALGGKVKSAPAADINKNLLAEVISEQLLSLKTRIEQGTEKNEKLSMEFIDWVIIEYNLKSAEKINHNSMEVISEIITKLKERGAALDQDKIDKEIMQRKNLIK
jgi:hypothetical protein